MAKEQHEHYEHYSASMVDRLDGFFGQVDARMNRRIAQWVAGRTVLDVGCGFGNLVDDLRIAKFEAVGVDMLGECVEAGRQRYPVADLRIVDASRLPFESNSFDTVILKDTIHHIYDEGDIEAFLRDVHRVCRRRLIVFDPNPTAILLLSRRLIGHVDPVCAPRDAIRVLSEAGFREVHTGFSEVVAFPLSGGYVGPQFVPRSMRALGRVVLNVDQALESLLGLVGAKSLLCWRYMVVADKADRPQ